MITGRATQEPARRRRVLRRSLLAVLLVAGAGGACSSGESGEALHIANPCDQDKNIELYRGEFDPASGAPTGAPSATATIEHESIATVPLNDLSFDDAVWSAYMPREGGGGGGSSTITPAEVVNGTVLITAFFC